KKTTNLDTLLYLSADYQLVGQRNIAKKLVENLATSVKGYKFNPYTYGSSERDKAMILETLTLLDEREKGWVLLKSIAADLNSGRWYSTQTTAYSLMAISEYLGKNKTGSPINAGIIINGKLQKISSDKPFVHIDLPESKGKFTLKDLSGNILFAELVRSG